MSDTIDSRDVTDRAKAGGWGLPEGWTVRAEISPDLDARPTEYDCYTPAQVRAWREDVWQFVHVSVRVTDAHGREWGSDGLGANEYGRFPLTDEDGTETGDSYPDPFEQVTESDMLNNAMREAFDQVRQFAANSTITMPPGAKAAPGAVSE